MTKTLKNLRVLEEEAIPEAAQGRVVRFRRMRLQNEYVSGEISRPYGMEMVSHRGQDAVTIVPFWDDGGVTRIMLLRAFRPILQFRDLTPEKEPFLLETVAGVLEAGEGLDEDGVRRRAAAETLEEVGFVVEPEAVRLLGAPFYASPGIYTEKVWVAAVRVDTNKRVDPPHDGSVYEELIAPVALSLDEALARLAAGTIRDAKTEIALQRFARLARRGV